MRTKRLVRFMLELLALALAMIVPVMATLAQASKRLMLGLVVFALAMGIPVAVAAAAASWS